METLRQRRRDEIRRYWQDTDINIVGNERLRTPQAEGYVGLRDYFAADRAANLPAIVVLPTGCGKSGLIACAPFGIATGRVLVVAPNLTIKDGLANGTLAGPNNFYQFADILPEDAPLPQVVTLERGRANEEDCLRADIVVTNVQQMQGWLSLFPRDFFDLILVDEAHHAPADSWQNINGAFPDAKKIYLTATPFRGDEQPIRAELVYTYRLSDAIAAGYVKNLMHVDALAKRMTFTMEGQATQYTREEVMRLREETWFSRGVALSPVCNETIIDRSTAVLQEKRRRGREHHQIIAAACSIRHAEQIAALYRSRGLNATFVASSGMTMDERERRIRNFDRGHLDAIVHVGILGEGYDNPTISIAAIFRPFRSTAPYAQFVGRAIRALPEGTAVDNIAHVVTHAGLNQAARWNYFKHEVDEAAILADIDAWTDRDKEGEGEKEQGREKRREPSDPPEVTSEYIEGFDVDMYLPVSGADAEEAKEQLQQMDKILADLEAKGLSVPDAGALRRQIIQMNQPIGAGTLPPPPNRPDLERQAYRRILNNEVKRAAGTVLHALGIDGSAADLVSAIGQGDEQNNIEVVIRTLHRRLNRLMNKDASQSDRNAWLQDELRTAKRHVPALRDSVIAAIEAVTSYRPSDEIAPEDPTEGPTSGGAASSWDDLEGFDWGEPF
jgi:superfamily II DNA or RNA helicase